MMDSRTVVGRARIMCSDIRWIHVLVFWICVSVRDTHGLYGSDQSDYFGECNKFLYSTTIEPPLYRLIEVHIRHNFRGYVEIRDGNYNSKKIRIEIEKTGPSELEIENIITNETLFDVGRGNIFVLQLDHVKTHSRTVTIVIGAAIAGAIFLTLTSLLIWWYYRKRNQPFSPMHGQGLTGGSTDGRESTYDEELLESTVTTPVHRVNGGTQGTQSCPPPPPPCRGDPTYMSTLEARGGQTVVESTPVVSSGVGSPRGMSKTTVVTLSIVTVISVVYASCPYDAQARVIIIIPPMIKLESIKVFFNKNFQNEVFSDGWQHKNGSQIHVFELDDASPTPNPPCVGNCPNAYIQNLAGCDAATGECVCQHGYDLVRGVCVDIDECSPPQHYCPPVATCQNTIGSYICQCGYGFYGDRKTCKPCSKGCSPGFYEASPCTNFGDRVCKECTKCEGAQYEARPCGETVDRQCMHVAHPLLIAGDETTPVFLEGLKVEASDNVFLEDLHNIRNLETIYYVTDTTQAYDFFWVRDSGLQVNIGVLEIHLIPEYEDVDHDSDNKYMLRNPNNSEDKTKFRHIVNTQCRNPIPDYYTVTLEISRDRTTKAEEITCDDTDWSKPRCPDGYVNGDTYLYRTLNEACPKMGTFPEELEPAANSIVCTDNSDLLREIFNQSYTIERPIRFPPHRCKVAQARCDQCLDQPRCKSLGSDIFEQKCCQIDCYTLPDCKLAQSEECTSAPVECAMGDAYRYTIQPVFQNIRQHYMCHIRRREPQILYQIFFFVQIPERGFQTPKVYKTIYARDLDYQSEGEFRADYITVEHNTGLKLDEEFILIGQVKNADGQYNHSIHSLKQPDDYRKKRVVVHEVETNIYVASTQFRRPFDYSTSSWVQNNECKKNISNFQKVQRHYSSDGQPVNLMTYSDKSPFTYYLKSTDPDPFIRFKVPGNMSILPYYFQDDGPELITGDTLKADLRLTSGHRIWEIQISGQMTGCPAYLGITINNRIDLEEIFRYDLLILCPAEFNLTFKVPNWGQDPDKTFDVRLHDARRSYDVYLTQMIFEQQRVETEAEAIKMPTTPTMSLTLFSVVGAVTVVLLLFLLAIFIYTEHTKSRVVYKQALKMRTSYQPTVGRTSRADDVIDAGTTCVSSASLSQRQTVFVGLYIFVRVVYSLLFTFTVFFAILMLFLDADLRQLNKLDSYQGDKYNSTMMLGLKIDQYSQGELLRQSELVTSMQGACSHYIGELFDAMAREMDNITANQHQLDMYGSQSSISYLMYRRAKNVMERFADELENYTGAYQDRVRSSIRPFLSRYHHYLKNVFNNDWYKFAQKLFNDSGLSIGRPRYVRTNPEFSGPEIDFGVFLEIEEVENVQLWDIQFWENYLNLLPNLPELPVPKVDHQAPQCQLSSQASLATRTLSNHTALNHLSSAQFISTHLPELPTKGPKYRSPHFAEEYKFVSSNKEQLKTSIVFSVDEFVSYINVDLLRIVFLILDAVLLMYRFSHTYMNAMVLCHGFQDSVEESPKVKDPLVVGGVGGAGPTAGGAPTVAGPPRHHRPHQSPPTSTGTPQTYTTLTSRGSHYAEDSAYLETGVPDYSTPLNGQRTAHVTPTSQPIRNAADPGYSQTGKSVGPVPPDHNLDVLKHWLIRLVLSQTLPKMLISAALLMLFYLFIKAAIVFLDVTVISQLEGFSVFLGALDIQLNQTNWYLLDQANHFNDVTMKIYEGQMTSELLNLKSMVDYFNSEQHRLVENYLSEACAITREHHLNWTCEVSMTPPTLQIPMLPCNFIPIQPNLYTAFNSENYERHLGRSFEPYVSAARNVILKCGYAILLVVACMLLVHIAGIVLFHFLKTRHKFPVRRVYVSSTPPRVPCGIQNPAQGDESEYDSDEHDTGRSGTYATYSTPTRLRSSPQKANTLSTDFKYSETKV